ncbi:MULTISPECIES: Eco57I restriction-modification methylase domain-containing protein [Gammaproteobacteria]|uniref:Eco57I restriction-modification methylase domain-containing protein n=1 Tax=Gammaproteobacteria TaxID=1236 RepID=UPI0007A0C0CE|nr:MULTISPECIES: N-6 DNA methylase [Gammaproteobacteria]EGR0532132.1 SAM-dependent DNA methyltransferase [Vibrio parahaemolyticus]EGR0653208.1 SAM-dependent DNA methyltransferase [Vibrio parahaemolyticus]EGR0699689.1 SAM-dependent DNA methyltransferase [Vibrio parahaemolyticus]EGR0885016.1 SAM-dependent DNA methyltransferase [Vibrio parahaemolyticus]EGR2089761.1 SAM-dependent DNA methyltransferase [Vibrio parahaemolyticus]
MKIDQLENQRQILQAELDAQKTQEERNIMGQFSTPNMLANDILTHAKNIIPTRGKVRFLDPAFGTGSFYSALNNVFSESRIEAATGFEIDEHYGKPASKLWEGTDLNYQLADFTKQNPPAEDEKYNLIICNPPYVRHHHIKEQKERLQAKALEVANMKLSGLAGLYCHFMALAHPWMEKNGIAGWLVPSEFMDVNYGQAVKDYLLKEVTLLQIHRFDPNDVQFDDALVSSAVVWFRNKKPAKAHKVKFTYGGTIDAPTHDKDVSVSVLEKENKWTRFPLSEEREENCASRLNDFFDVKRGIATGDNKFFVLTREQIESRRLPLEQFRPILPSPRYLNATEIKSDENGYPEIENQLFVLDCKLPFDEVKQSYPELYEYLEEGIQSGVPERYLCKNRKIWYSQEQRSESCFYCTYIGRSDKEGKKPFRFILNRSKAIVSNSYLILYPKPLLEKEIKEKPELNEQLLQALNQITGKAMTDEGRVYGGGLHKMEPKELANVPANEIWALIRQEP